MRTYPRRLTLLIATVASAALVAGSASVASAADETELAPVEFPSASSTIVGSTGFIDGEQVGYFWSAARGDSVAQTITGKKKVKKAKLVLDVVYNGLAADVQADWTLSINGTDVGSLTIPPGQTGQVKNTFKFKKIKGKSYDVKLYMTNEVRGGGGSITLRYAGAPTHTLTLK